MIKTVKHKGLSRFYNTGSLSGIQAHHVRRLQLILTRLDASICPEDMDLPGLSLHKLKGQLKIFILSQYRQIGELYSDLRAIMLMMSTMSTMLIITKEVKNV